MRARDWVGGRMGTALEVFEFLCGWLVGSLVDVQTVCLHLTCHIFMYTFKRNSRCLRLPYFLKKVLEGSKTGRKTLHSGFLCGSTRGGNH